jgi:zinc D-Ala-D-Ala carboxypeptidase
VIGGPSAHLSWLELACHDGTPYPAEWRASRAVLLAEVFERVRAHWGKPITVASGFRTRTYNQSIGGARGSQHCEGRALDLRPPAGVPIGEFYRRIAEHADAWGVVGLGRYRTFVHVDIRPGRRARWSGQGVS